jgi:hypothetical protein
MFQPRGTGPNSQRLWVRFPCVSICGMVSSIQEPNALGERFLPPLRGGRIGDRGCFLGRAESSRNRACPCLLCCFSLFPLITVTDRQEKRGGKKGKDNTKGKHFLERERSKREKPTTRPRRRGLCRRLMRQTDVGRGAIRTARAINGPTSTLVSPAVVSGATRHHNTRHKTQMK